jgi:hypothetical protein
MDLTHTAIPVDGKEHFSEKHTMIIGMLALLGGQFFHASHAILEEHILTRAAG